MNLERANWKLDANRDWHVSWFQECLHIIDRFTHQEWREASNNAAVFKTNTNLCHYVRCSVLWGPGILALHLITLSLFMGAIVFLPIEILGLAGYIVMLTMFGIFGLAIYGTIKLSDYLDETNLGRRFNHRLDSWLFSPVKRTAKWVAHGTTEQLSFRNPEGVSLWSIVWAFVVTLKHQVCPLIKIEDED